MKKSDSQKKDVRIRRASNSSRTNLSQIIDNKPVMPKVPISLARKDSSSKLKIKLGPSISKQPVIAKTAPKKQPKGELYGLDMDLLESLGLGDIN